MLVDKRNLLREAQARETVARTTKETEEKRRAAEERRIAISRAESVGISKREESVMARKSVKSAEAIETAVKAVKKTAEAVKVKAEEKAVEVKEAAEEKAVEVKAAAEEKAVEVKKAVDGARTAAVKKARTVKKTEAKCTVYIEFGGKQIPAKSVLDEAVKAYKKAHKGAEIKTVELYIKPEENAAYYVVNGEAAPDFRIEL